MRKLLWIANLVVVVLYVASYAAGDRRHAAFLSGGGGDVELGVVHVSLWFALVLWVPITTLALILEAACGRLQTWSRSRRR